MLPGINFQWAPTQQGQQHDSQRASVRLLPIALFFFASDWKIQTYYISTNPNCLPAKNYYSKQQNTNAKKINIVDSFAIQEKEKKHINFILFIYLFLTSSSSELFLYC